MIEMTSAVAAGGSPVRRILVVILAVLGVLGIVAGILYAAGVANHMSFLVGSTHKGHHQLRLAVSFVLGVVLLAGAWFLRRGLPASPLARGGGLVAGLADLGEGDGQR